MPRTLGTQLAIQQEKQKKNETQYKGWKCRKAKHKSLKKRLFLVASRWEENTSSDRQGAELDRGHFFDPTRDITDPIRPDPRQINKFLTRPDRYKLVRKFHESLHRNWNSSGFARSLLSNTLALMVVGPTSQESYWRTDYRERERKMLSYTACKFGTEASFEAFTTCTVSIALQQAFRDVLKRVM